MSNTILAVIVTFNRLELLKRCYNSLLNQSIKDFDILIVNNGSTDGTKEWINTLPNNILRIHQENLGGAGGFYAGQKYGYENGYDWIWMMDDDGEAHTSQLKELLTVSDKHNLKFVNPMVVNIENKSTLSLDGTSTLDYSNIEYTPQKSCPFNGTLINRSVIDKIGLIKAEMFIWGDEVEYRARARMYGFELYTIPSAIHYHPAMKIVVKYVIPKLFKWKVKIKPSYFSHYFYRNLGYFNRTYCSRKVQFADYLFYNWYFISRLNFTELFKFHKYYRKGMTNKFID